MSSSQPAEVRKRIAGVVPATLTGRLVALVVALVAVVGLLVAAATAIAMRSYLTGRLDNDLGQAFSREQAAQVFPERLCPLDNAGTTVFVGQGPGLTVRDDCAYVVGPSTIRALPGTALRELAQVPADGRPHSVSLDGVGRYRVISQDGIVSGLPLNDVNSTVRSLVWWELALTLTGVLAAALVGGELVRRTLRPLRAVAGAAHEVTGQQLESGAPSIETRVPEQFTDPATEVGQVGSALNTLLDHVDAALSARHRSEQQVRQFVADASHELRTPLSTIHGYAELSRRTPDDAERLSTALTKVETEADRMSALVEDMLLLARLDSGRPLADEEVDVTRVLLEAVADARVVAPDHEWRLRLPEEPVTVPGDEARLHQVVTNLLNNARVHTPAGTTVTVGATADPDHVELTVADDGPGLPADLVPHAFERFTRGDSSRTRASGGAGLGLSLVAAIVAAHGGTATVESRPGHTMFVVTLPRS